MKGSQTIISLYKLIDGLTTFMKYSSEMTHTHTTVYTFYNLISIQYAEKIIVHLKNLIFYVYDQNIHTNQVES